MEGRTHERDAESSPCLATVIRGLQAAIRAATENGGVLMRVEPGITDAIVAHRVTHLGLSRCALACARLDCEGSAALTVFPTYVVEEEPVCERPSSADSQVA